MMSYDLLCLGNAIVDVICKIEEKKLLSLNVTKGSMKLVSENEFNKIINDLSNYNLIAGGSAANTAVGFASLGGNAGFVGQVGDDKLGNIFKQNINKKNVNFFRITNLTSKKSTSKSIILVTEDGERTMLTHIGASSVINFKDLKPMIFCNTKFIYIEGYLFDDPITKSTIIDICEEAKKNGVDVALSLSDTFCVIRHKKEFLNLITEFVNIVFCNELELKSLFGRSISTSLDHLTKIVKKGAVTLGGKGSLVFDKKETHKIKARKIKNIIDSTGAGDLYASGFLYGLTKNFTLIQCGELGSLVSSEIISYLGASPKNDLKKYLKFIS